MIGYEWKKLIHRNSRGRRYGMDCQVVTAVNAYYLLTGKRIGQTTERYKKLCRLAGAVYGCATRIEKAHEALGIELYRPRQCWLLPSEISAPIEVVVRHPSYGLHSALIVDAVPKCQAFRLTNMGHVAQDGWMFRHPLDLMMMEERRRDRRRRIVRFRTFRLVK